MFLLHTARWVLLHLLRQPLVWLWLALLVVTWPALQRFSQVGITATGDTASRTAYEVAFIATLVGVTLGLGVLGRARWFLEPVPALRRLSTELAGLAGAGLLFAGSALLVLGAVDLFAPWTHGRADASLTWGGLPLGTTWSFLHLAALGLVLLRLELPGWAVQLGLPLLAWALPGVLGQDGSLATVVQYTLAAGRHLDPEQVVPFEPHWLSAFLPILGLLGVSWLLSTPPGPPDEIRHPR